MERLNLEAWCQTHARWALRRLDALIAECFDHFRSTGELGYDWPATLRNWIRRAPQFNPALTVEPQARQVWKAEETGPAAGPAELEEFRRMRRERRL